MNQLEAAERLITESHAMIEERDRKRVAASDYLNIARQNREQIGEDVYRMFQSRATRLQREANELDLELKYVLAFSENLIEKEKASC